MKAREWDVRTEAGVLACYDATADDVHRYAQRLAHDPNAASDLLQEAFLALIRQVRAGTIERVSTGWLITAVRHRYLNQLRGDDRERRRLRLVAVTEDGIENEVRGVGELTARMSDRERAAVVLRYVDGFSVRDVAEQLDLSVRATESLLARAKARVRGREARDA